MVDDATPEEDRDPWEAPRPAGPEPLDDPGVTDDHIDELEPTPLSPEMSDALQNIDNTSAAEMDAVTTDDNFRAATLRLLDGEITVDEWLDEAAEIINDKVDLPWIPEVVEGQVFRYAMKLAGQILHGFLRGGTANAPTDG